MKQTAQSAQANMYYDADYFGWQQQLGSFDCGTKLIKFQNVTPLTYKVLDFGAGDTAA